MNVSTRPHSHCLSVPEIQLPVDAHPMGQNYRPLTVAETEEIIAMDDPVRRNLRITQGYHDLKIGMTQLLGWKNVSWCGFATWASRTAGRFIRGEYVSEMVQSYLGQLGSVRRGNRYVEALFQRLTRAERRGLLTEPIENVTQIVTENVGWGNLLVFDDLAGHFARMIETFTGATSYDQRAIEDFVAVMKPGRTTEGGEDLLKSAFRNYYKAMFTEDGKEKAELILMASNQVGYHEQTRLQDAVVNSLNAPIADFIIRTAQRRAHEYTHRRLHRPIDLLIYQVVQPLCAWLQREWSSVATRWLMRIDLPEMSLSLAEDLPHRCEHYMFPKELLEIEHPELEAMLATLDYTPNTTEGSAAKNWGDLGDRMNFVVDFFRTRQQDQRLFWQPFADEQVEVIRAGGLPDGDL